MCKNITNSSPVPSEQVCLPHQTSFSDVEQLSVPFQNTVVPSQAGLLNILFHQEKSDIDTQYLLEIGF